jgi:hypothetical protein
MMKVPHQIADNNDRGPVGCRTVACQDMPCGALNYPATNLFGARGIFLPSLRTMTSLLLMSSC